MDTLCNAIDRRAGLMQKMIDRLNVDLEASALVALGTKLGGAARACFFCRHADECQRWFEAGAGDDGYRRFCPNADRFEALPHRMPGQMTPAPMPGKWSDQ
jgi:hypothetical protein